MQIRKLITECLGPYKLDNGHLESLELYIFLTDLYYLTIYTQEIQKWEKSKIKRECTPNEHLACFPSDVFTIHRKHIMQ